MTSNQKKALKAEHTNRLKNAFVKALQQEQVSTSTPVELFTNFLQCWLLLCLYHYQVVLKMLHVKVF